MSIEIHVGAAPPGRVAGSSQWLPWLALALLAAVYAPTVAWLVYCWTMKRVAERARAVDPAGRGVVLLQELKRLEGRPRNRSPVGSCCWWSGSSCTSSTPG